jgi:predicted ATPase
LFDLGFGLAVADALFHCYRLEPQIVRVHTEEGIALSEENGFAEWLNLGRFLNGWSLAELGHLEQGVVEMEAAIASFRQIGGVASQPYFPYFHPAATERNRFAVNCDPRYG